MRAADFPALPLAEWRRGGAFFTHAGHQIFYRQAGAKDHPPLLLLHGFPTGSWDFAKLWGALAQKFHVIIHDMIGFGFSDKPRRFPYSVSAQADVIETMLRTLSIDHVHILAHDYGDTIAQELLARQLDGKLAAKIDSVCFLNGGLFPETHRALLIQKLTLSPLGPLLTRIYGRRRFDQTMIGLFAKDKPPTAEELDGFWQLVTHNDGKPLLAKHIHYIVERRVHRERFVGAIVNATIPIRLIDGALDPVSGAHMAARYRELIPNPDIVLLNQLSHYPHVEDPDAVLTPFLAFHPNY